MKKQTRKNLIALSLTALMSLQAQEVHASETKTLLFGIVPQQAASKLAELWVPLMDALSQESGFNVKFATMKDIPSFEECLAQGAFDIAYMNPYHYTVYSEKPGYSAFAHQSDKKLKGIIVAHKDADINSLEDLDQKTLAFPSPAAFGASVLPRAEMKKKGIEFEARYVRSHDSVYRAVASKLMPAGGGVLRTLANIGDDIKGQLKVIYETDGYTPHAFAFAPSLDQNTRWELEVAFNKVMTGHPEKFRKIGMRGIEVAADSDWDQVRNLGLSLSQTEIRKEGKSICRFD